MTLDLINAIVVSIGIPFLIGACIFVGVKLNVLNKLYRNKYPEEPSEIIE